MPFKFEKLSIPDVILITPEYFEDERGLFMEVYNKSEFEKFGIKWDFVQDNFSMSRKGVLRGLHYQKNPKAQAKLVRCVKGEIFNVAVDIRKGSPYYGKWVGEYLSRKNKRMMYLPVGFAHGFFVISDETEVIYRITQEYSPEHKSGIIWNDPIIGIEWPIKGVPTLSKKDSALPSLGQANSNFIYSSATRDEVQRTP